MGKLAIVDTADVVVKRKKDGKVFLTAEAQLTSITQSLGINESIFGGIGSKKLFQFKGQKEVSSVIRNAFYDKEFLAMTQGVDVQADGSTTVYKREDGLIVTDNVGVLEVTITGSPIGTVVYVRNNAGETEEAVVATNTVEIPTGHAMEGDIVNVTYQETVTGDIIEMEADKFGESFEIEYRTIGYDIDTNTVKVDIYIQLDNAIPQGDFEISLENGNALAPEFNFDALANLNGNSIGRIVEVERV